MADPTPDDIFAAADFLDPDHTTAHMLPNDVASSVAEWMRRMARMRVTPGGDRGETT